MDTTIQRKIPSFKSYYTAYLVWKTMPEQLYELKNNSI